MKIIDAHCHIGQGLTYSQTPEELLLAMDRHEVAAAVVVPADRFLAVDNWEGNTLILAAARKYPNRFIAFATANPWYGAKALEELNRAFDSGAVGLKLHPVIQGCQITDEIVFPVVELAVKHRKPIYFHTGTPISSTPYQLTELAMRYPEGVFIMGHAAYADFWNDVVASVKCVPNLYVETSQHLASFIRFLVGELGPGKIIYGSDAPKTAMSVEIEKITRWLHDEDALSEIFSYNIERILCLR